MEKIELFKVYSTGIPKVRYGRIFDGGYVIHDNLEYDCFLGGGVGSDISFEHHFLEKNPGIPAHIYDHTKTKLRQSHPRLEFHKVAIGAEKIDTEERKVENLHEFLNTHKNVFVKMDIEGWEIPWLNSLSATQMQNIRQLAIEFHNLKDKTLDAMKKINETHWMIHFHGNNCNVLGKLGDIAIPKVFECTYVRKTDFPIVSENTEPLPSELDSPNSRKKMDFDLNYYPFVNKK